MELEINDKSGIKPYLPSEDRYSSAAFRRCGQSGVLLPSLSLGLWHNFGFVDSLHNGRMILRYAFDNGITHFDLANNYGPSFGSAEEQFGTILKHDFRGYRDELFISSKAGFDMWPGPYGNLGSRKYLVASIDQSLKRMGLDYVDVYYHHRPDPDTPLEETMGALDHIVRQGKALYAGISNYTAEESEEAISILRNLGTPCLIHQARYSMFDRWVEDGLLDTLSDHGVGCIAFSPLAQGMLTDRYLNGIPENSRAAKGMTYLERSDVETKISVIKSLNDIAVKRGQSLSQMAISWILRKKEITSVLIGASSVGQLKDNLQALENTQFSKEELKAIEDKLNN